MNEKESKRLQEEALRLAEVLWAGRDDDTARLLREGVRAMRERDELLRCPFITHCQHQEQGEGAMDLRKRHDDLDRRATEATAAEERALADFTGAIEEVRGKLCRAAGMPSDTTWELLVPTVEALRTNLDRTSAELDCAVRQVEDAEQGLDHAREARELASAAQDRIAEQGQELDQLRGSLARANEEREAMLMALKTVRDVIVAADARITGALGEEPTKDAEYASDLTKNVERLIGCMEENAHDHREELAALQKEVAVFKESDKTQAAEWKRHVWNIAAALNVPRVAMGRVEEPNVDQIVKFVNQNVLPTFQLAQRVSEIEGQLRGQEATTPPGTSPAAELLEKAPQVECEKCGAKRIAGIQFCPSCGKE